MLKVALTGGIATGKSHVLAALARRGVPCLDADELAHEVMAAGTAASAAIGARFGAEVLTAEGAVDRRRLAPRVFSDPQARRDLEAIVHPAVYDAIHAGLTALARASHLMAVADVPLLYESGHEGDFDCVVATVCSPPRQRERLRARGLADLEVAQRLAAQWPAEEKAARADLVISTDGTFEETDAAVERTLALLRTRALRQP